MKIIANLIFFLPQCPMVDLIEKWVNQSSMSSQRAHQKKRNACYVDTRYYYGQFGAGEKPCQASNMRKGKMPWS